MSGIHGPQMGRIVSSRNDEVLRLFAQVAVHGVETLREQLGCYGIDLHELTGEEIEVLRAVYMESRVRWKLLEAHAEAADAFAKARGVETATDSRHPLV